MKFGIKDFQLVKKNTEKNYFIKRNKYYETIEEAEKDAHKIYLRMKNYVEKNDKYKGIFVFIGASQIKGKTAQKIKIKTKGRPRYEVLGKKCKPHIHIAVYGKYAPLFTKKIVEKINHNIYKTQEDFLNRGYNSKRLFEYEKLEGVDNGLSYIPYMFKQSEKVFTIGKENLEYEKIKDGWFYLEENF